MWQVVLLACLLTSCLALRYDAAQVAFNLNENTTATDPAQYWGESLPSPHPRRAKDKRLTRSRSMAGPHIQPLAYQLALPLLHPLP